MLYLALLFNCLTFIQQIRTLFKQLLTALSSSSLVVENSLILIIGLAMRRILHSECLCMAVRLI